MDALLLIDIQNDYFPGGRMELEGAESAGAAAGRLLAAVRERDIPAIHIRHESVRPAAGFFLPGTPGAAIHQSVSPLEGEVVLTKHFPNSFRETGLEEILRERKVKNLAVAGMMSHMCVDATVRAVFDLGFECILAADACATRDLEFAGQPVPAAQVHASFMASLAAVYARVVSVETMLVQG